jgi:hypothetical protein
MIEMGWRSLWAFLLVSALAASMAVANADEVVEPEPPGIPPGQDELLLAMLGKGESLPGGCEVGDVSIVYSVIEAHYNCSQGEVVLELTHSSGAYEEDTQTRDFAIAVLEGSPPTSLVDEISVRVLDRENGFEWVLPGSPEED